MKKNTILSYFKNNEKNKKIIDEIEKENEMKEINNIKNKEKRLNLMDKKVIEFNKKKQKNLMKEKVDIEMIKILNKDDNELLKLPSFLNKTEKMDKNKRKIDNPNYDNGTLYIPEKYIKNLPPIIKHYWKFKEQNYDKIIFIKLRKFYELLYEDAIFSVEKLGLKFKGKNLNTNINKDDLDNYINKLNKLGKKIGIIEDIYNY